MNEFGFDYNGEFHGNPGPDFDRFRLATLGAALLGVVVTLGYAVWRLMQTT